MTMLPFTPGPWSQVGEARPNSEMGIFHRPFFQVMGLSSRPRFPGRPGQRTSLALFGLCRQCLWTAGGGVVRTTLRQIIWWMSDRAWEKEADSLLQVLSSIASPTPKLGHFQVPLKMEEAWVGRLWEPFIAMLGSCRHDLSRAVLSPLKLSIAGCLGCTGNAVGCCSGEKTGL